MKNLQKKKIKAYQVESQDTIIAGGVAYTVKSTSVSYGRRIIAMFPSGEEECYETHCSLILPPLQKVVVLQPK